MYLVNVWLITRLLTWNVALHVEGEGSITNNRVYISLLDPGRLYVDTAPNRKKMKRDIYTFCRSASLVCDKIFYNQTCCTSQPTLVISSYYHVTQIRGLK